MLLRPLNVASAPIHVDLTALHNHREVPSIVQYRDIIERVLVDDEEVAQFSRLQRADLSAETYTVGG